MRVVPVLLVAFVAAGAASGRPNTTGCGDVRVQGWSGNQIFVSGGGPRCLYRAYRARCIAATLRLRMMGVDTLGTLEFRVVKAASACRVRVAGTNTVYAGHPRTTTWRETCRSLARRSNGIAVKGCNGEAGDYLLSPAKTKPRRV